MTTSAKSPKKIDKRHLAFALALIAALSYVYSISVDRTTVRATVGMMTAIAKVDSSNYQMFLKLEGIAGDSMADKHRDEIEADSFAWTQSRAAGTQKPMMHGLTITMPVSKASPRLLLFSASGLKVARAVLTVRMGGKDQDFLKWILTDSQIVSYQSVGNTHGDGLSDQITIIPGKVEVEYREPLANGSLGDAVRAGWDLRTGKSVQ